MIRRAWIVVGLICYYLDSIVDVTVRRNFERFRVSGSDKTGRLVSTAEPLEVTRHTPGVLFVHYRHNFGHSLWRSQELSLFNRYRDYLRRPRLDFGCGDGSFSSVLFDCVDYGVDRDPVALQVAHGYHVYKNLICCDGASLPVKPQSVASIYSNSVLEHVDKLDEALWHLSRALRPGGILMFTVPVRGFAEHLARFFGEKESVRINRRFGHKHLLTPKDWRDRLQRENLMIERIQHYQPDWFSFWYRVVQTRVFHIAHRCGLAKSRRYRLVAARMVEMSISNTIDGGNIFVIARR